MAVELWATPSVVHQIHSLGQAARVKGCLRTVQGQLYKLPHVLLFSILAIVTGCNSYRGIVTFIDVHRHKLNATFGLKWRRAPAYTAIRYILKGLDPADVEVAFRRHDRPARLRPSP